MEQCFFFLHGRPWCFIIYIWKNIPLSVFSFIKSSLAFKKQRLNPLLPQCTHPSKGDPGADYLQSIVIEIKDGAMVEIYNSPNSYGGVKTLEIGEGWDSPCPCATSSDSQAYASGKPKMSGGESWAPSRQAAAPSLLLRNAMLFVMVPLERAVSRIFNAKWAEIRRFLHI